MCAGGYSRPDPDVLSDGPRSLEEGDLLRSHVAGSIFEGEWAMDSIGWCCAERQSKCYEFRRGRLNEEGWGEQEHED